MTPIWSITLLSCLVFIINGTQSDKSWQFSFDFDLDQTYTFGRVVVLSGFYQIPHLVRSITITQFRFRLRPHLYDRSSHYSIWFWSQIVHTQLDRSWPFNSVSASIRPIWSITSLSCLAFVTYQTLFHNNSSLSFLVYTIPVQLVMLLSYLIFIKDGTRSDRSW